MPVTITSTRGSRPVVYDLLTLHKHCADVRAWVLLFLFLQWMAHIGGYNRQWRPCNLIHPRTRRTTVVQQICSEPWNCKHLGLGWPPGEKPADQFLNWNNMQHMMQVNGWPDDGEQYRWVKFKQSLLIRYSVNFFREYCSGQPIQYFCENWWNHYLPTQSLAWLRGMPDGSRHNGWWFSWTDDGWWTSPQPLAWLTSLLYGRRSSGWWIASQPLAWLMRILDDRRCSEWWSSPQPLAWLMRILDDGRYSGWWTTYQPLAWLMRILGDGRCSGWWISSQPLAWLMRICDDRRCSGWWTSPQPLAWLMRRVEVIWCSEWWTTTRPLAWLMRIHDDGLYEGCWTSLQPLAWLMRIPEGWRCGGWWTPFRPLAWAMRVTNDTWSSGWWITPQPLAWWVRASEDRQRMNYNSNWLMTWLVWMVFKWRCDSQMAACQYRLLTYTEKFVYRINDFVIVWGFLLIIHDGCF